MKNLLFDALRKVIVRNAIKSEYHKGYCFTWDKYNNMYIECADENETEYIVVSDYVFKRRVV